MPIILYLRHTKQDSDKLVFYYRTTRGTPAQIGSLGILVPSVKKKRGLNQNVQSFLLLATVVAQSCSRINPETKIATGGTVYASFVFGVGVGKHVGCGSSESAPCAVSFLGAAILQQAFLGKTHRRFQRRVSRAFWSAPCCL
jgi:hypothetical protein